MEKYAGYTLNNFSVTCVCGKEYGFKSLDEVKTCKCGKEVKIQDSLKATLVESRIAKPPKVVEV